MTANDQVMIGSDGSIARRDSELRKYDQWLLVWIGPKIREMLAGRAATATAVHMVATGEFLFTGPHGVLWHEVAPAGLTGRPGTVRAVPDITGLDETAHERLLGLMDGEQR